MTVEEAAIVAAYTGILIGKFSDMHGYAEQKLGRPIFTHEFANPEVVKELKEKTREDFINISVK
jgi:hypothetical protein